jgi:RNA polymerase subunit RPABC4/transcription elongation factor Spt4
MSEGTGLTVECDVCETAFDPTAAGGWCTNPECGEWKYDGDAIPSPSEEPVEATDPLADDVSAERTSSGIVDPAAEYPESEPATGSPEEVETASDGVEQERDSSAVDADEAGEASDETEEAAETADGTNEETEPADGTDEETESADEETADDADDVTETADVTDDVAEAVAETEAADETVETPEPEDGDARSERAEGSDDAEITCPGCAQTLDAATNFCPNCGEDVSAVEPGDEEIAACPACGDDVDADDSFCASCGENLEDHRGQPALTECPDCGASVDDDDSFCADCGENLDDHRDSSTDDSPDADGTDPDATELADEAPESLLLTTRGREIAVTDGETVGRKLREILTETGGDENDAVRIHREHVRFVREDGQFYLIDLGENPTEVNGSSLAKGDRKRISPGDEITLSDVATLTVAHP